MKKVSLVVPCYNEADVLDLLYKEVTAVFDALPQYELELLLVDDGSRDNTLEIMKRLAEKDSKVKFISFSRNFGKEAAMLAGLKYASGEYIGIIDADLQHSPDLLPPMIEAIENEGYDVAAARRTDRAGEAKLKSALSEFFYKIYNKFSDVHLEESAQDFRVMKRKVVEAIISLSEKNRFSKGIFTWVGFKTKWFEHENRQRAAGETKWSVRKLLKYAIDGLLSFTNAPLRLPLYLGGFSIVLSVLVFIVAVILKATGYLSSIGIASIIAVIMLFSGIILLCLGIMGMYLARIYDETRDRPVFIISESNIEGA